MTPRYTTPGTRLDVRQTQGLAPPPHPLWSLRPYLRVRHRHLLDGINEYWS